MRRLPALLALALTACTAPGPQRTLNAYADALEAGRLDRAAALVAKGEGEALAARYPDEAARRAEAERLRALGGTLRVLAETPEGQPVLVRTAEGWRVVGGEPGALVPPAPDATEAERVRQILEALVSATDRGDFQAAYTLLSRDLRARYSPDRLETDFVGAGSAARDAVERLRAALAADTLVVIEAERAYLPTGAGLAVRLVREDAVWRVAALQ